MRNHSRTIRTLTTALVLLAITAGTALYAQNSDALLKDARDAARLAVTSGVSPADAAKSYEKAVKDYQAVIDSSPNSPQAADALKEQVRILTQYNDFLKSKTAITAPSGKAKSESSNSPADMLATARDASAQTQRTGLSTTDLDGFYKKSIDTYNELIKKHAWTSESVTARLELGKLLANANLKNKNLEQAYKEIRLLLLTYDIPLADLQTKISKERSLSNDQARSESEKISDTVVQANEYRSVVLKQWNEANSKKIEYKIMDFFVGLTGHNPSFSYWFAIVLITVLVKVAITPLTKAQFKAMKEMQKVAPLIKEVQTKHKGDQKAIGEKTMAIYKEHKISPFASCLPLIIQMPILMGLFYTIKSYEPMFVNGKFLWIGSTAKHIFELPIPSLGFSAGDKVFLPAMNLFEPDLILVVLYLISMYFSTKLSSMDPSQADQQKMMAIFMPLMMAFVFAGFPSAFLLYWLLFNILQTVHQVLILRAKDGPTSPGAPILAKK
jgi:YidC/Oxa1 family membrane protein insertase